MSSNGHDAQPPPVVNFLPILISELELGIWDNAILIRLMSELDSTPETLLPAAMPKLTQTAFLLWKCGQDKSAKRILFTCLAWYLKVSNDREEISAITKNLQYIFEKEGRSLSEAEIQKLAVA
jgi:hypothetical protein